MNHDITVHHLEASRSHRVLWLLEELGVEYAIERYQRDPKTMRAPEALKAIHPLGKAPVVSLDGHVLAESGAILDTLVETLGDGRFRPKPGTEAFRRYRYFLHYAEGSLMPPLLVALITEKLRTVPMPFFLKPIPRAVAGKIDEAYTRVEIPRHFGFLDAELGSRPFITGDELTAADVQLSYPVAAAASRGFSDGYPNVAAYLARLEARPAYQKAIEIGGPVVMGAD